MKNLSRLPRPDCSPWAALVLSVLIFVDTQDLILPVLAAAAIHELGHLAALGLLGKPARGLSLRLRGAVLRTPPLGYREELAAAAAGPAANLLAAALLWRLWPQLGAACLLLAAYNLLPVRPLDGGRMVRAAAALWLPQRWTGPVETALAAGTLTALAAGAVLCACRLQLGLWPILLAAWVLGRALCEKLVVNSSDFD